MQDRNLYRHYHKVGRSNFPWWVSVQVFSLCSSLIIYLKYGIFETVLFRLISLISTVLLWGRIVVIEGLAGNHVSHIQKRLKFSFGLFLLREAMFFMGIFWFFFDRALAPTIEIGEGWSPMGIVPINPYGIPLFNTVVLLRSGITSTLAHNNLLIKKRATVPILWTLLLATCFEGAQYVEYKEATFRMSDGVYGRVFFFGTGFHGLHVIFGHAFLGVNTLRLVWGHFRRSRHIGLELALLYWHFVDVVWLFLYVCFYWWAY